MPKNIYQLKRTGQVPIRVLADGYKVETRDGVLRIYEHAQGSVTSIREEVLTVAPGKWDWIRKVGVIEDD